MVQEINPGDAFDASRMLTDTTGALNEFQVMHLKRWPLVALAGVESCEAHVAVGDAREDEDERGNKKRLHRPIAVEYLASTKGEVTPEGIPHTPDLVLVWGGTAKILADWTRTMFWPDTQVTILIDGYRVEFESAPE